MFKQILTFYRIQTAGITISTIAVGLCLSTFPTFIDVIFVILIGLFLHATGFGLNNLLDYKYDTERHGNPLKHGMTFRQGMICVFLSGGALFLTLFLGLILLPIVTLTLTHNNVTNVTDGGSGNVILIIIITCITFGILYNLLCKKVKSGYLLFFYIFFLILFGYSLHSETITFSKPITEYFPVVVIFVGIYAGIQIYFQVAIEGSMKDIDILSEVNYARDEQCEPGKPSERFMIQAVILKFTGIYTVMSIVFICGQSMLTDLAIFTIFIQMVALYGMMKARNRKNFIKECGLMEISTYTTLILVISPIIGNLLTIFLIIFPLFWFIFFNKLLYNTYLNPKI